MMRLLITCTLFLICPFAQKNNAVDAAFTLLVESRCQHSFLTPAIKWRGRKHFFSQHGDSDNVSEDFVMPSPDTPISEIPVSKRGIGVGIDLGTTNSAVSILNENDIPQLIKVDGTSTIPSVVTLQGGTDNNSIHIGKEEGDNTFTYRNVKRIIGMGTIAAACSAEVVPHLAIQTASQRRKGLSMNKKNKKEGLGSMKLEHMMKEAQENPARLRVPDGYTTDVPLHDGNDECDSDNTTSPEYISSKILRTLFRTVEETTGERITRAVIGVPAYFNDMQREATIKV